MALFSNLPPPISADNDEDNESKNKVLRIDQKLDEDHVENVTEKNIQESAKTTSTSSNQVVNKDSNKTSTDINGVLSMKTTTSFMPSSLRSRKPISKSKRKVKRSRTTISKTIASRMPASSTLDANMFTTPCDDDYDPAEPNNYMDYCEQRRSRENMKRREEEHRYVIQQQQRNSSTPIEISGRGRGRGLTIPAWMKRK